ncbi:MAG: M3 family oligoendopeptidase [Myxococcota bacterium]
MTSPAIAPVPDWDMTPYFPEFGGPEYSAFRDALAADVEGWLERVQELGSLSAASLEAWAQQLASLEDLTNRSAHLGSYLGCLGAADARSERIQTETARAAAARAELQKAFVWVRAALRETDDEVFEALKATDRLRDVAYFLDRLRERAAWSMEPELEALVAELGPTGFSAWGRLYDQLSGKLEFDLEVAGRETRRLPVSMRLTLLQDPDPAVRRATLLGTNRAWQGVADVVAACLNGIAGQRLTLYRRRGVPHFLDPALFDAAVGRPTLDTLLEVVKARQEVARRFLRRKARLLGRDRLGFQDLHAPLPVSSPRRVSFDEGRERVLAAFEAFHAELGEFAGGAFDRRWIDWRPRPGKRPGGFCSSSSWIGESRVFITYDGADGDVSTLAHELGHAYHAWVVRGLRPWATRYPMTLAETASTFAEQLVIDAGLSSPDTTAEARASILDGRMRDATAFLLDIPMRFDFEKALYAERGQGELAPGRLCELMEQAQRENFGDTLARDELDPWFWASKLHFYITGLSFYNFPYTFGYLFSLGIFARAKQEGPGFLPRYRELLALTGSDTAERVARRALGVDLEQPEFWNASIDLVEAELGRFEEAVDAL